MTLEDVSSGLKNSAVEDDSLIGIWTKVCEKHIIPQLRKSIPVDDMYCGNCNKCVIDPERNSYCSQYRPFPGRVFIFEVHEAEEFQRLRSYSLPIIQPVPISLANRNNIIV